MPEDADHRRRDVLRLAGAGLTLTATGGAATAVTERDDGSDGATLNRCGPPRSSPRPGPDLLYEEPLTPPQLEPGGAFSADPLLVSGTDAYVDGEYLYQDFVYDDHGANTSDGPTPPSPEPSTESTLFSAPTGDVVYPTDVTLHDNAADLLEFRATVDDGVRYRVAFTTFVEAATAVAIGIDTGGDGDTDWGHGLGDLGAPVDHVLVAWGSGALLDGEPVDVTVDTERDRLTIDAPLDPGDETWTHYCVTGLVDAERERFRPVEPRPTAENPGGSNGQDVPPVFNVGFRFDEPLGAFNAEPGTLERQVEDAENARGTRGVGGYGSWRDHAQATALESRDVSEFGVEIAFDRLRRNETEIRVPDAGYTSRLYASRVDLGDGVEGSDYVGQIQPYSVYVPEAYDGSPTPLFVNLHSLGGCYNQFATYSPNTLRQLGEERDAFVFTPEARGPDGWYHDEAERDVFEAWADLRHRYEIDEDRVTLGGYSMGGYGTYRFASQYPDLFAKAFATVGPADEDPAGGPSDGRTDSAGNSLHLTDNLRHVPLLMWAGSNDELVPLPGVLNYEQNLRDHGYRHELDVFTGYEHFTFAVRDQWGPGREFLDGTTVERDPARVTYRRDPAQDNAELGLVHDGAYWVSDVAVADGATDGLVDAISLVDGYGEPVARNYERQGTEPAAHVKRGTEWIEPVTERRAQNALEVALEGVAAATLWIEEAGLDPTRTIRLDVTSDSASTLTLAGSFGEHPVDVPVGETSVTARPCEQGN